MRGGKPPSGSRLQIGCSVALVLFSAYVAVVAYPHQAWLLGASLGGVALLSVVIRVGWVIPCTIAGVYVGMCVLDPAIKGGDPESQMMETVGAICIGTVLGMAVGFLIEGYTRYR
jgi:hypothetical protein